MNVVYVCIGEYWLMKRTSLKDGVEFIWHMSQVTKNGANNKFQAADYNFIFPAAYNQDNGHFN